MKRTQLSGAQPEGLGGYAFTLAPLNAYKLYVGTYKIDEPKPKFHISLDPPDDESVAYQEMTIERKGHYRLYYHFENFGQMTVGVRVERLR